MDKIKIKDATLKVTTVKTSVAQRRGLMNRRNLPGNEGMLFEYPSQRILKFWMKNTYIPLSIAFVDENKKIIEIKTMQPQNEEIIESSSPAKWAIEANQGWFAKNNIEKGDTIKILGCSHNKTLKIKIEKIK